MSLIFISYRRGDDSHAAGRLYRELIDGFGRDAVFMDVDSIPPGADFVQYLEEKVAACKIMLAIIGGDWIDTVDEGGARRIESPLDFVRIEIEAALSRKIPVIPVLIDDTVMPKSEQLPDALQTLARRQALRISHTHFRADFDAMLGWLRRLLAHNGPKEAKAVRLADVASESVPTESLESARKHPQAVEAERRARRSVPGNTGVRRTPSAAANDDVAGIPRSKIKRSWQIEGFEISYNESTLRGVIDTMGLGTSRLIEFEKAPITTDWDDFWKHHYLWTLVESDDGQIYAVSRAARSPD